MKSDKQFSRFFQVVVLGCMVLWSHAVMSAEEGQKTGRFAEVTPLFGDGTASSPQASEKNRHQSRSQLFQGAIEELRKNPAAADIKECKTTTPRVGEVCMRSSRKV